MKINESMPNPPSNFNVGDKVRTIQALSYIMRHSGMTNKTFVVCKVNPLYNTYRYTVVLGDIEMDFLEGMLEMADE